MALVVIDRTKAFSPGEVLDGSFIAGETDRRSRKLTKIDPYKIKLLKASTFVEKGESFILEEYLRRLKKTNRVRLDTGILSHLVINPDQIRKSWRKKERGARFIFPGDVFRDSSGKQFVLFFYFIKKSKKFAFGYIMLGQFLRPNDFFAVL